MAPIQPEYDTWSRRAVPKGPARNRALTLQRATLTLLVIVLVGELLWFLLMPARGTYRAEQNRLAIGASAKAPRVPLQIITKPAPITISTAEILRLRKQAAERHADLLEIPYQPFPRLLEMVADGQPWLSVERYYFSGKSGEVQGTVPVELLGLENPYLLVLPDFTGLSVRGKLTWKNNIPQSALAGEHFPYRPEPSSAMWYPAESRGELRYNIRGYLTRVNEWALRSLTEDDVSFDAVTYNAYEFGYQFVALLPTESQNVVAGNPGSDVKPLMFPLLYVRDERDQAQGYNGRGWLPPELQNIRVQSLPARAVFALWHRQPESALAAPDASFSIIME